MPPCPVRSPDGAWDCARTDGPHGRHWNALSSRDWVTWGTPTGDRWHDLQQHLVDNGLTAGTVDAAGQLVVEP